MRRAGPTSGDGWWEPHGASGIWEVTPMCDAAPGVGGAFWVLFFAFR